MPPLVKIYDSGRVYYIEESRIYNPFAPVPKKTDPKDKDEEPEPTKEDDLWSESSQELQSV